MQIYKTVGRCSGLNVCVPPNSAVEILTPQCDGNQGVGLLGKLGHEGVAFMNGISALIRRDMWTCFLFLLSVTWGSSHLPTGKQGSPRTWQCWHPGPGLPASRTVRNGFPLINLPSLWYLIIATWTKIQTQYKKFLPEPSESNLPTSCTIFPKHFSVCFPQRLCPI